jgi:hypothetical protein
MRPRAGERVGERRGGALRMLAVALAVVDGDDAQAPTDSPAPMPSAASAPTSPDRAPTAAPTAAAPTTTSTPTTTATTPTTTTAPDGALAVAVWPTGDASAGYADPAMLVRDFAVSVVGMDDPDVGPYLPGDTRSGEIEVRAAPGAVPATTVYVRQLVGDAWWVLGAASPNIAVESPRPLDTVASPIALRGTALAFEGTVAVALWHDGADAPLTTTFVTGSGAPPAGPFAGELTFPDPPVDAGALVLTSASGEDGAVVEFAVFRVFFG